MFCGLEDSAEPVPSHATRQSTALAKKDVDLDKALHYLPDRTLWKRQLPGNESHVCVNGTGRCQIQKISNNFNGRKKNKFASKGSIHAFSVFRNCRLAPKQAGLLETHLL